MCLCNEKSKDENVMTVDTNCTGGVDATVPYPEFGGKTASSSAYDYFPFFFLFCFLTL